MKKVRKILNKKLVSVIAAAAMVLSCFSSPVATQTIQAESEIAALLTDYKPTVTEEVDPESGFTHPGVGLTKEHMETVQTMVRAEKEPWKTYFEYMLDPSGFTSKTVGHSLGTPENYVFSGAGAIKTDANRVYAQAVMYLVTGDNAYRKNAINILRAWGSIKEVKWFNEAYIHVGIAMNKMLTAAEIIRYTSYEVTDGYTEADLKWTDEEIQQFKDKMVRPAVLTFSDREGGGQSEFMNQHLYSTINAMSGYLFLDDKAGYEKMVEWTTVNKEGANPGFNGSITRLFRKITTYDVGCEVEGTGTPLTEMPEYAEALNGKDYVVQHVEMGRDQAHGCGDLNNAVILARMMQAQNTKVDPVEGTVSTAEDAVNIYEFGDDRILETADFFFEYMLGYDPQWVPVAYSIRDADGDGDKEIIDFYWDYATGYRGRYQTINFNDVYTYYTYNTDINIKEDYKYLYEGFMKKLPSDFYNTDGGADFWLFLPEEAANNDEYIPEPTDSFQVQIEDRGALVENAEAMEVMAEGDVEFIRFSQSDATSKVALTSCGTGATIAFRVRTDGVAKLSLSNGESVWLPDTDGEWQYVTVTGATMGDIYFVSVDGIQGDYVDIDTIDLQPSTSNTIRTIDIMNFTEDNEDINHTTLAGTALTFDLSVENATVANSVAYTAIDLPEGATVNATTGEFTWTPDEAGEYSFYVVATAGVTSILKQMNITVFADRAAAIEYAIASYDEDAIYVKYTEENYLAVYAETLEVVESASVEEFAVQLAKLNEAVAGLELVSPILENDTISAGGSLDYMKRVFSSSTSELGRLADSSDSFCGYYTAQEVDNGKKQYVMDFGPDFKISVEKFGYMSRFGFPDRVAGVVIHGSNDGENWELLSDGEAQFTQIYHEVDALDSVKDKQYRYLRIYKQTHYPEALRGDSGSLLEFSEWRVWGTFYETGNMIKSVSMSSEDAVSGRIKMGDTVSLDITTKGAVEDMVATIQGVEATVSQINETTYKATAVMKSGTATGDLEVAIDYTKEDGNPADTYFGTSDGSTLFLVNSDIYIDVAMLAAELTASHGSWPDQSMPAEECAKLVFDGDITTFPSLLNGEGEYYHIDFGEGVTVSLSEVMLMPRESHPARLNGTYVLASNDLETWTDITTKVSGAVAKEWTHLKDDDVIDNGSYRYFRIAGATNGDISEVEFYGTYNADPALIAAKITELPDQEPSQTHMVYPAIPSGYTVTVKESSNEAMVALGDGAINTPQDDTMVDLVLTVTNVAGQSADTAKLPVKIKGIGSLITGLDLPARDAESVLPEVPEGFTVTVKTSSNEDVIELGNGAITTPEYATLVDVTLELVRESDNATVVVGPFTVFIYGEEASGKIDVASMATVTASNGYTSVNLVFDGSVDTFADTDNGTYYTIEFGADLPVILERVRLYPRSDSNDKNAARSNGAKLYGSVDGTNWVQITNPVEGAKKFTWVEFPTESLLTYSAFNYFKIEGATRASMAEVEFYGVVDTSAEKLAEKITSVPDVTAAQTAIVMPSVPSGYTITIDSTSNAEVIDKAGKVYVPDENTTVDLTFKVEGFGKEATTKTITVNVQGVADVAASITSVPDVLASENKIVMPTVLEGYTVSINSSSDEAVIDKDGNVYVPDENTIVNLTFKVEGFGKEAVTGEIPVNVQGMAGLVPALKMPAADAKTLTLPTVQDGFTIAIKESSNTDVIALDGTITTPAIDTLVTITLELTRTVDSKAVEVAPQTILVYGATKNTPVSVSGNGTIEASNDPYPAGYTKVTIAQTLIDGKLDTFGDLKGNGGRYTIDFGEGTSVILDKVRLYPRSTKADHAARLNGTYIQGSVDGTNWVNLTPAVENAVMGEWKEFVAEDFLAYGDYRYFCINGSTGGNIAEVEFYGVMTTTDDAKAVKAAKDVLVDAVAGFEMDQVDAENADAAEAILQNLINPLLADGVTATVEATAFDAAVKGTPENPAGTNGTVTYTITVSRGEASVAAEGLTATIIATLGVEVMGEAQELAWNGKNATFKASASEEKVVGYEISLYKDGELVEGSTKTMAKNTSGVYSYYYNAMMQESGAYTFKVVAKADAENIAVRDSAAVESAVKNYVQAEIAKGEKLASFDFENMTDGMTEIAGVGAKATVEGTSAYATYNETDKAANLSNNFWMNLTKEDGTPLLAGLDEITISYDGKLGSGNQGWAFFAAPNTNGQTYKKEKYLGILDTASKITVERYNNTNGRSKAIESSGSYAEWKHVDVVVTLNNFSLYVDGELKQTVDSTAQLYNMLNDAGVVQIGKANWGSGEYYYGLMDNLEIYYRDVHADVKAEIEAVKTAVTNAFAEEAWEQDDVSDGDAAFALVEAAINELELNGVTAVVNAGEFVAAVAGTEDAAAGTDGSYTFAVTLTKAPAIRPVVTEEITVAINATAYVAPGPDVSSGDAVAVADAKEAVEAAIADIELAQADVADEAAAKAAVQAAVDAAIAEAGIEGVTAVVEGNGYTAPTAGTEDAEDGVDGAYTFIVTLTKGEESDVVAEKTVVITAKAYDAHQHTFSTEWTSDDTYHWHAATCEHTEETLDKAEHTSSDWIVDGAPSTTAPGSKHKECTVCEKVLVTEEIPQLPGEVTGGITGTVKSFSSDSTVDNTTTIQVIDVSGNVIAQTTVAESEGSYTLTDVSSGDYTVKVSKEDHVTREYNVTVGTEMVTLNVEVWLIGDVNGDGDVNAKDKKRIFNHIEGSSLTDYAFAVGNVDGKGDIDAKDKKMVYNHIEGNSLLWE